MSQGVSVALFHSPPRQALNMGLEIGMFSPHVAQLMIGPTLLRQPGFKFTFCKIL